MQQTHKKRTYPRLAVRLILLVWFLSVLFLAPGEIIGHASPLLDPPGNSPVNPTGQDGLPPNVDIVGDIYFEHLGMEDGLPDGSIQAMLQDDLGFIWFGTKDGLTRYDGYSFVTFRHDPENDGSLSDDWINVIYQDSLGHIWVGTRSGGLNRYDPVAGTFSHFQHEPDNLKSLVSNQVQAIFEDEKGRLWIGTDKGLEQFFRNTGDFRHYTSNQGMDEPIGDNITAIATDSNGGLLVGTHGSGLKQLNPFTGLFKILAHDPDDPTTISNNYITAIAVNKNGSVWVGTEDGLNLYRAQSPYYQDVFYRYTHSQESINTLSDNHIHSLFVDEENNLWIGTASGLDYFDRMERTFIHYQHEPRNVSSLSYDVVTSIFEDSGRVLWVGTDGAGVNKYARGRDQFAYIGKQPLDESGLSGNVVTSILSEANGSIWIGTFGDGLNRYDPVNEIFFHFRHSTQYANSISSDEIWALEMDADGVLWVGTSAGLDRFELRKNVIYHYRHELGKSKSLISDSVFVLHAAEANTLWIGTDQGLDRMDTETNEITHFRPNPNEPGRISGSQISAIYEDSRGNLWIGTLDAGLNLFDAESETFRQYRYDPTNITSLSSDVVQVIFEDNAGMLWVGTAGGGLNMLEPGSETFVHYQDRDGLPSNVVNAILEDGTGNLWISTNYGITRLDPERETFYSYTIKDGLQGNEFSKGAAAIGSTGEIYLGGFNGITVFDPQAIRPDPFLPKVVLTNLTQGGTPISLEGAVERTENLTLWWPENSFEFEFAALSFARPEHNQYAYLLEGYDEDWYLAGTQRYGRYSALPGGEYTLYLMASNHDGTWAEPEKVLELTVIPPIWQRLWFQVAVGSGVVMLFAAAYTINIRRVQRHSRELESLVRERTFALQKYTEELEAMYSADELMLRTQTFQQVFQALVDVAVDILHADCSVLFEWDGEHREFIPRLNAGYSDETLQILAVQLARRVGEENKVVSFKPLILQCAHLEDMDRALADALGKQGICTALFVPLQVDEHLIGIFNAGFTEQDLFTEDTVRLFTALTQRASLSIENVQLIERAKEVAILEERNRLARDLHDSAKQKAFAAMAQIGAAGSVHRSRPQAVQPYLEQAEELVFQVIQELTFLIQEMHPLALKEKGLAAALRDYMYEWETRTMIDSTLVIRNGKEMGLEKQQAIYRIVQEALANIARHSKASCAEVVVEYLEGQVVVKVLDNGGGFDLAQSTTGMGLRSMQERVMQYDGQFEIHTQPGRGTEILATIPLPEI